ncbi:MAG: hypothetical protein NZ890_09655, partial [Myxococcota bacterium]|nr:hypothetical protein [Myxococcota bacterium]
MKPMQPTLLALAAGLMFSAGAQAVFMPPGGQPLYIKFDNKEQISLSNSIPVPGGGTEGNWGILKFSTIALGDLSSDPIFWDPISPPIWVDSSAAEITGIFWGIQNLP